MAVYYAIAQDACRKELGWSVQQYQRLVELRAAWPARSRGKGGGSSQLHIGEYLLINLGSQKSASRILTAETHERKL